MCASIRTTHRYALIAPTLAALPPRGEGHLPHKSYDCRCAFCCAVVLLHVCCFCVTGGRRSSVKCGYVSGGGLVPCPTRCNRAMKAHMWCYCGQSHVMERWPLRPSHGHICCCISRTALSDCPWRARRHGRSAAATSMTNGAALRRELHRGAASSTAGVAQLPSCPAAKPAS